jgi:hypothetical protein
MPLARNGRGLHHRHRCQYCRVGVMVYNLSNHEYAYREMLIPDMDGLDFDWIWWADLRGTDWTDTPSGGVRIAIFNLTPNATIDFDMGTLRWSDVL